MASSRVRDGARPCDGSRWPWGRLVQAIVFAAWILSLTGVAQAEEPVLPAEVTSTVLPTDGELEDCWARLQIKANPGPFQYLAYEVTSRGPAGVISHVRGFMGRSDVVTRTELTTRRDLRRLLGYLRDLGALQWPAVPPSGLGKATQAQRKPRRAKKGKQIGILDTATVDPKQGPPVSEAPVFEFSFRLGGVENTVLVTDPEVLQDRRYARYLSVLRALAQHTTGEIAYQGPAGPTGEAGYLFVDSVPGGDVSVDGAPLGEATPILSWTVAPGNHVVVIENARLGLRREVKVKVQSGLTTSVEVELQ